MKNDTGVPPRVAGPRTLCSGISSPIMMCESPILISACMIRPSGPSKRDTSSAPNAFRYQSIAFAAPFTMSWA